LLLWTHLPSSECLLLLPHPRETAAQKNHQRLPHCGTLLPRLLLLQRLYCLLLPLAAALGPALSRPAAAASSAVPQLHLQLARSWMASSGLLR
jgi:hypothetical protein